MKIGEFRNLVLVAFLFSAQPFSVAASEQIDKETMADEIATLFLSLKVVILKSQPLINDSKIGNKELTGKKVVKQAKKVYKDMTGKDFEFSSNSELGTSQKNLFKAADKVMKDAAPLINREGIGFKGFITAIFARRLAREFSKRMEGKVKFKFTAPNDILRSRANRGDDWENNVFEAVFRKGNWDSSKNYTEQVGDSYRWMKPVYHEQVCMSCHGGPKGEKDITGTVKEGAKVGDLAGAFSIIIND